MADDSKTASGQGSMFPYLALEDPSAAAEMLRVQNQMALAQALMQRGMEGSPGTSMAGNVAIRNSPLTGLANMLNTYAGGKALTGPTNSPSSLPGRYVAAQNALYRNMMSGGNQPSYLPSSGQQAMAAGPQQVPNQVLPQGAVTPASNGSPVTPLAQGGSYQMGGTGPTPFNASVASNLPAQEKNPLMPTDEDLSKFSGIPEWRIGMMRNMQDPDYTKIAIAYQDKILPEVRRAVSGNRSPSMDAALTAAKETTLTGRAGGYYGNPATGFIQLPTPEGTQNYMGPDGQWHSRTTPEAGNMAAGLSYAGQAGKTAGTMQTGVNQFGQPSPMFVTPPANPFLPGPQYGQRNPAPMPTQPGPGNAAPMPTLPGSGNAAPMPTKTSPSNAVWTPPYGGGKGTRLGMSPQESADMTRGATYLDNARQDAMNIGQTRELLQTTYALAKDPRNSFGPGSPTIARLKAMGSNAGFDLSGAQTAQDILAKVQSQIVSSQLGSNPTDSRQELITHQVPGGAMTNDAILTVVPMIQSQLDLKENRAQFAQHIADTTGHQGNVPSAMTIYNRLADPATITLGMQMAAATAAGRSKEFRDSMTPEQQKLMVKVKKLDQLGAF